jgi:hypothetical protein
VSPGTGFFLSFLLSPRVKSLFKSCIRFRYREHSFNFISRIVTGNLCRREKRERKTIIEKHKPAPKNTSPRPGFWSVIPATVRYDPNIPDGSKLLFAEITALCNKKGFCWAGNTYFANLYQKNERTVRRWIDALKNQGYILVSYRYIPGTKEIESRTISLPAPQKPPPPPALPQGGGGDKNVHTSKPVFPGTGSFLSENSPGTANFAPFPPNIPPFTAPPALPREGGGDKNVHTSGHFCPEVGTKMSGGMDKNVRQNTTSSNNKTTTATASTGDPEPAEGPRAAEAAAQNSNTPEDELKNALIALDKNLVFDRAFYPRARSHMDAAGLDRRFLPWLRDQCLAKKPRSLAGLYFTLFFAPNIAEIYRLSHRQHAPPPPEPCPLCGHVYQRQNTGCPQCGLPSQADEAEIARHRKFIALPEDRRNAYSREINALIGADLGFLEKKDRIGRLKKEFGLL